MPPADPALALRVGVAKSSCRTMLPVHARSFRKPDLQERRRREVLAAPNQCSSDAVPSNSGQPASGLGGFAQKEAAMNDHFRRG